MVYGLREWEEEAHRPGDKEVWGAHGDQDTWSLLSDWSIESKGGSGKR